jgi:probable HAF family extracellular repeat protein
MSTIRPPARQIVTAVALLVFTCKKSLVAAPLFISLGSLPGEQGGSGASSVSADGMVVVGIGNSALSAPYGEAFRWSQSGGMISLGDIAGGAFRSWAFGASADGSVVVGRGAYGPGLQDNEAFRWTQGTGMVGLGDLPGGGQSSEATAASADGSIIVGNATSTIGNEAFRWTQSGGMVGLGGPAGGSGALNITPDGSTIVGWRWNGSGTEAMRWTQATGMVGLGELPGGAFYSEASDVSNDGSVVVGRSSSANTGVGYSEAFRWTQAGGMVGLGDLPGGLVLSSAAAVSGDGSIIVGSSHTADGFQAMIWDAAHGMRNLRDVLINEYGLGSSLAGFELAEAYGISADGTVIVGVGSSAWVAVIPEPPPIILLFLGFAICIAARRVAVWPPGAEAHNAG